MATFHTPPSPKEEIESRSGDVLLDSLTSPKEGFGNHI